MTNITIPPEALEKAAKELRKFRMQKFRMGDTASVKWDELNNYAKEYWLSQTRAACLALINNWPGMHVHEWQRPWLGGMSGTDIILPLTEKQSG